MNNYKYEKTEKLIKFLLKGAAFLPWLGIFSFDLFIFVFLAMITFGCFNSREYYPFFIIGGITVTLGFTLYSLVLLLKWIMGNRSFSIPLSIVKMSSLYAPEKMMEKLKNNRCNVLYVKTGQGRVKIYGNGDTHVLEIQLYAAQGRNYYHMIDPDPDSIILVSDDTPTVLNNKWHELLPVRNSWLMTEEKICAFLRKLYESKDIKSVMENFSFTDSTGETQRLIDVGAYIIPSVPVDWPLGGLQSNMGREWMQRKEDKAKLAMDILSNYPETEKNDKKT